MLTLLSTECHKQITVSPLRSFTWNCNNQIIVCGHRLWSSSFNACNSVENMDAFHVHVVNYGHADACIETSFLFHPGWIVDLKERIPEYPLVSLNITLCHLLVLDRSATFAGLSEVVQCISYSFLHWMAISRETFQINPQDISGIPLKFAIYKYHFIILRVRVVYLHDFSTDYKVYC